jgi:peptidoglycan/xylan/chitin deacetylase (PgdA/CDA1 family)
MFLAPFSPERSTERDREICTAMSRRTTGLLKAALSAMHFTGADGALAPLTRGAGVIFMLHHVRPEPPEAFAPNRILTVTPDFLETVIQLVLDRGFDVLSLSDVHYRLAEGELDRPFAAFTFDDGYRDNYQHAYPIFRRHGLPFTVYVPSDFAEGRGDLWWLKLESVVRALETIEVKMHGAWRRFECREPDQKDMTFDEIYWWLRSIPEREARGIVDDLCRIHDIPVQGLCRDYVMTWDEIRALASDPLVTIGAHTRAHYALAKLTVAEARLEIEEGVRRLEAELGRPCRHFSYPYGDETSAGPREFELTRELGFDTAVTTRKGLIHASHADNLTALPRLSLNGNFQHERYVKVMLSGAPFAIWNAAQRVTKRSSASY